MSGDRVNRTVELPKRKSSYHSPALGNTDAVATGDHMEGSDWLDEGFSTHVEYRAKD